MPPSTASALVLPRVSLVDVQFRVLPGIEVAHGSAGILPEALSPSSHRSSVSESGSHARAGAVDSAPAATITAIRIRLRMVNLRSLTATICRQVTGINEETDHASGSFGRLQGAPIGTCQHASGPRTSCQGASGRCGVPAWSLGAVDQGVSWPTAPANPKSPTRSVPTPPMTACQSLYEG
jgi:hypothetical protein